MSLRVEKGVTEKDRKGERENTGNREGGCGNREREKVGVVGRLFYR